MKCGHACPYKVPVKFDAPLSPQLTISSSTQCHSDDPNHVAVRCEQVCTKLCARGHPCAKACAEDCGQCMTRIAGVQLPCGHTKDYIAWYVLLLQVISEQSSGLTNASSYQLDELDNIRCDVIVRKQLTHCEHEADTTCSVDPANILCERICDEILTCCGRSCKAQCHTCQRLNEGGGAAVPVVRSKHLQHPCNKLLYCGHLCENACSEDHQCTTKCKGPCRQVCAHTACNNYCSTPCAPCQEACTW